MSDDLLRRLRNLHESYELDDIDEVAYLRGLDKLRDRYGAAVVNALLPQQVSPSSSPPAPHQRQAQVGEHAQVGVLNLGDVGGDIKTTIYLYGRRTPPAEQVLATYLHHLSQRCLSMSLQGVREQKADSDVLSISLDQVYTQLATTDMTEREVYEGEALRSLDAEAYLKDHTGTHLLPVQQRIRVRPEGLPSRQDGMHEMWPDLDTLAPNTLSRYTQEAERITFFGLQLVSEAMVTNPHLVLLGEPGSGKSTALRHIAMRLAEAGLDRQKDPAAHLEGWRMLGEQGRFLPLLLPLLPFSRLLLYHPDRPGTADDLWNHLATTLEGHGRAEGLAAAVHDELEAGRVLLLLDGLDEVVGSETRSRVVGAVQAFAQMYPQCRIVVSCRVRAYAGEHNRPWQLVGWPTATLADWTVGQMQHFVAAWYGAAAAASGMSDERREEWQNKLHRAIEQRTDLKRLGVRPLMMTVMALVHLNDGRLPEDRVTLYSRCVDLLLAQWELAREDGSDYGTLMDYIELPNATVKSLRPLLQVAAFTAHEASTPDAPGSLGRDTLKVMVCEALQQQGHANPYGGAERFLQYTDIRAGLLQASDAGDAYVFPHLTFQEYLAGLELVRGVDFVAQIMARRNDDRWRVPILLGVGHLVSEGALAMPYQLLNELLMVEERTEAQRQRDLLFAAEIADDVGWGRLEGGGATFKKLRRDLAHALTEVVEGRVLPATDRVQAGVYLGTMGDPRPAVTSLPPEMVELAEGTLVLGSTKAQAVQAGKAYEQYYLAQGDKDLAKRARTWPEDEINDRPVTVAAFALARYPITNAQYQLFINEGGYEMDMPWWDDAARAWLARDDEATEGLRDYQKRRYKQHPEWWRDDRFGIARPNHPVVGVSWYEAVAFCRWLTQHREYNPDGSVYRLPTEAEWEYAARGTTRRIYPWGNEEPDGERANFDEIYEGTTAIGCFPLGATTEGLHELAGQVWEWTGSVYRPYPYDPTDGREDTSEPSNKRFVNRGGGWLNQPLNLRASNRFNNSPDYRGNNLGFRPARHLPRNMRSVF